MASLVPQALLQQFRAPRRAGSWQRQAARRAAAPAPCRRLPTLRAAQQQQWQAPPGLSILPWTGDAEQTAALEALKQRMAASLYPDAASDEGTLRWFLQDRKMDVEEAEEKLLKMLRWRREFGADSIEWTDVAKEAATGKAYLHSQTDISARPVIIVRAAKHLAGSSDLQDSQRLCVHLMDLAVERLEAAEEAAGPGGPPPPQTVLGIFDLRGFTSANADWGFVRFLVDIFFLYYPKRLSQVLFVEAPWVFKPGWEIVKPWLKKYAALVRFVSADEVRREFFTPDTVPEDFGGQGFPPKGKGK
ncbi:hypothetical protein D9Q98_003834 [Chlorella vulgaris]|uniref:CRAL-TRIO domain-containing protein n=1 Tax=Chlorella vulgaris TaxID=3077 RepID=A0A9D4TQV6_CHLVU|nr:hypothetical protein D9Q98_003834 [Chlorella vulgaris]